MQKYSTWRTDNKDLALKDHSDLLQLESYFHSSIHCYSVYYDAIALTKVIADTGSCLQTDNSCLRQLHRR